MGCVQYMLKNCNASTSTRPFCRLYLCATNHSAVNICQAAIKNLHKLPFYDIHNVFFFFAVFFFILDKLANGDEIMCCKQYDLLQEYIN